MTEPADQHPQRKSPAPDTNRRAHRPCERRRCAAGRIGGPKRGRQTLRRHLEREWFPNHVIEATTREYYTYLINKYVLPELGKDADDRLIAVAHPRVDRDAAIEARPQAAERPDSVRGGQLTALPEYWHGTGTAGILLSVATVILYATVE
jgi:hypothetical protein